MLRCHRAKTMCLGDSAAGPDPERDLQVWHLEGCHVETSPPCLGYAPNSHNPKFSTLNPKPERTRIAEFEQALRSYHTGLKKEACSDATRDRCEEIERSCSGAGNIGEVLFLQIWCRVGVPAHSSSSLSAVGLRMFGPVTKSQRDSDVTDDRSQGH